MTALITKPAEHDRKSTLFARRNFSVAQTSVRMPKSAVLCSGILIWIACLYPAWSAPSITRDDLAAQREQLQSRLETNKELLQKDIEAGNLRSDALGKRLDDQVARVSDVGNAVDRFGVIVSILGTLITVLLTAGGLVGYFSVSAKARREAAAEAKKWFIENAKQLTVEIEELQRKAAEASEKIDSHLLSVANKKAAVIAEIEEQQASMNKTISDTTPRGKAYQETPAIQSLAEELRKQPESSYSFDDWNVRAFAAHGSGKLDDAAHFWGKAAEVPAAGAINAAQAMHNKGVVLEQLQRYEEAISEFDALITKYGQDPAPALRELVANAMQNKAVLLGRLERYEEAIATHDALITNYAKDPGPALREQVARTKNGKGFTLLCQAKALWTDSEQRGRLLTHAMDLFDLALVDTPESAIVLGNQAYCAWLLGNHPGVEEKFSAALAKPDGGKHIFEATLKDLEIHPVEEDLGFKALIEKLWSNGAEPATAA